MTRRRFIERTSPAFLTKWEKRNKNKKTLCRTGCYNKNIIDMHALCLNKKSLYTYFTSLLLLNSERSLLPSHYHHLCISIELWYRFKNKLNNVVCIQYAHFIIVLEYFVYATRITITSIAHSTQTLLLSQLISIFWNQFFFLN